MKIRTLMLAAVFVASGSLAFADGTSTGGAYGRPVRRFNRRVCRNRGIVHGRHNERRHQSRQQKFQRYEQIAGHSANSEAVPALQGGGRNRCGNF